LGALAYPKHQNPKAKYALWISSALTVGFWISPLLFVPASWITVAAGYTLSLVVPLSVSAMLANNFMFLNVAGAFSMALSTLFFQDSILPKLAGAATGFISRALAKALIAPVATLGFLLLFNMKSIVERIQEAKTADEGVVEEPIVRERSWGAWLLQGVDPDDEISWGYLIALSGVYVYCRLIYQIMKYCYREATMSGKKKQN